jgi:hypothetical protein
MRVQMLRTQPHLLVESARHRVGGILRGRGTFRRWVGCNDRYRIMAIGANLYHPWPQSLT